MAVPPIPMFPDVFKVERLVLPVTEREDCRLTPEVTVSDPPIETLSEVVSVDELMLVALSPAKLVSPVTFNPFKAPNPVMDPPTPTLPVVVRVFLKSD